MQSSIRKPLWAAFGTLLALMLVAGALNLALLRNERQMEVRQSAVYDPLVESMIRMEGDINSMLAAARGYTITRQPTFLDRYHQSIRSFERTSRAAAELARDPRDISVVQGMRDSFKNLRVLSDRQIRLIDEGDISEAVDTMLSAEQLRREGDDFAGQLIDRERKRRADDLATLETLRLSLTLLLVLMSVAVVLVAVWMIFRTERSIGAAIAREVERTEAMIAGMADGVMLIDAEGRVEFLNPAGRRILGRDWVELNPEAGEQQVFRNSRGEPLPPQQLPPAKALRTGLQVADAEVVARRPDGTSLRVSMNAVPMMEEGRTTRVVVSFRDVTERHELEVRLADAAKRATALAEAGKRFAREIDPARVAQLVASTMAELFGEWSAIILRDPGRKTLSLAAIHHRDAQKLDQARAEIRRHSLHLGEGSIGRAIQRGQTSVVTDFGQGASGERLGSATLVLPLRARGDVFGAMVAAAEQGMSFGDELRLRFAEDLAERAALAIDNARLYSEQVSAREKVESFSRLKDEFLSIASHELRTPVTSIKGYTQLARTLIRDGELNTAEEYLAVALEQIDRMSRLILELLDVSRIETGRLEVRRDEIDWSRFLRDTIRFRQSSHPDRTFRLILDEDPIVVCGDVDRLEQVLGNLIDNAVKYSDAPDEITVRSGSKDSMIYTAVTDHGIGIPSDEIGSLFERFHRGREVSTTNYGGLGLGLYISRQIVQRHGGDFHVSSTPQEGTTFTFTIPAADSKRPPEPAQDVRQMSS